MRQPTLWIAAATLVVAGCASPEAAPPPGEGPAAVQGGDGTGLQLAFWYSGEPVDVTVWANGTFRPEQASRPASAPVGSPAAQSRVQTDVSQHIPQGVPTTLFGDVAATMSQGDLDIWFSIPSDDFRTGGGCTPRGGVSHVEPGLVRVTSEPVLFNVFYDEAEPAPEVAYVASARIVADPTRTPGGVSVGLTVPAGTPSIEVELVGDRRGECMFDLDTPNLMLWGPDDAFLGHHPLAEARTTVALAEGAPAGEYVLLLSQGGRGMRVWTPTPAPVQLRALAHDITVSEPHVGGTAERAEWTLEVERVPILAGIWTRGNSASRDVTASLTSPAGALVGEAFAGGPWFNVEAPVVGGIQGGFWFDSGFGVPALVAGSYAASVSFERAVGAEPLRASDVAGHWVR